jgi:hypothetical protein
VKSTTPALALVLCGLRVHQSHHCAEIQTEESLTPRLNVSEELFGKIPTA